MSYTENRLSTYFLIGSIGYICGFFAWVTWFLLVVLNLVLYQLGYDYPNIVSGIFFQSGPYLLIVYSLFSISFLLGSFGCFALKKRYHSTAALICAISYVTISLFLFYSVTVYFFRSYIPIRFLAPFFLNLGFLIWGITLLLLRKSLPYPRLSFLAGFIFVLMAILTMTLFMPVIAYWGVEFWFMLFGWLYSIGAVANSVLLFRLSRLNSIQVIP